MIVSICILFSNLISYQANINLLCATGLVIFISTIITFIEFSSNEQSGDKISSYQSLKS